MTPRPDADRLSSLAPALSRVPQLSDAYVVSPALSEALRRIPGVTDLPLEPADARREKLPSPRRRR